MFLFFLQTGLFLKVVSKEMTLIKILSVIVIN